MSGRPLVEVVKIRTGARTTVVSPRTVKASPCRPRINIVQPPLPQYSGPEKSTIVSASSPSPVVRAPVRILTTSTNGRPDIGVLVAGGGTPGGYEALLAFDGARYPGNPTVAPARRIDGAKGTILIAPDAPAATLKD